MQIQNVLTPILLLVFFFASLAPAGTRSRRAIRAFKPSCSQLLEDRVLLNGTLDAPRHPPHGVVQRIESFARPKQHFMSPLSRRVALINEAILQDGYQLKDGGRQIVQQFAQWGYQDLVQSAGQLVQIRGVKLDAIYNEPDVDPGIDTMVFSFDTNAGPLSDWMQIRNFRVVGNVPDRLSPTVGYPLRNAVANIVNTALDGGMSIGDIEENTAPVSDQLTNQFNVSAITGINWTVVNGGMASGVNYWDGSFPQANGVIYTADGTDVRVTVVQDPQTWLHVTVTDDPGIYQQARDLMNQLQLAMASKGNALGSGGPAAAFDFMRDTVIPGLRSAFTLQPGQPLPITGLTVNAIDHDYLATGNNANVDFQINTTFGPRYFRLTISPGELLNPGAVQELFDPQTIALSTVALRAINPVAVSHGLPLVNVDALEWAMAGAQAQLASMGLSTFDTNAIFVSYVTQSGPNVAVRLRVGVGSKFAYVNVLDTLTEANGIGVSVTTQ